MAATAVARCGQRTCIGVLLLRDVTASGLIARSRGAVTPPLAGSETDS
jgi:hypothetical protein